MSVSVWLLAQPPRTRRLIALVAGPALLLTLGTVICEPIIDTYEADQQWLAAAQDSVARDRGLRQIEHDLQLQLADIERSPLLTRLYPASLGTSLATSLQADVGSLLARTSISAQTLSPLPSTSDDVIERAGVRVGLTVTIDQLRNFLGLLDSHCRLIRVEELMVTAPQSQMRDHNPSLTVTMVLMGFRLRQGLSDLSHPPHAQQGGPAR